MPIYKYEHSCGFTQQLFLREDKETKVVPCYRCGRNVVARQVRDKSVRLAENDGLIGVVNNDQRQQ